VDSLYTVFLVLSLIALQRGEPRASWLMFALALLSKFQAIIFLPVIVILTFRRFGLLRLLQGSLMAAAVMVIAIAPFVAGSGLANGLKPYIGAFDFYPFVNVGALNLWYVFSPDAWMVNRFWTENPVSDAQLKYVGIVLFGLYTLLICWSMWRHSSERREFIWASALYFGFFMLLTEIHERHLYPAVVLFLIGTLADRRLWWVALPIMFTYTYNVAAIADLPFYWLSIDLVALLGFIGLPVALLNLALFGISSYVAVRFPTTARDHLKVYDNTAAELVAQTPA
jgi:Gpi18-like mannosyltransferase